jgi:F-type H+-transporting ATPase subunit delta
MIELVAKRYAKALTDGSNNKQMDSYINVLDGIASALSASKAKEIIASPLVSSSEKISWVIDSLGKGADPVLVKLIEVMGEKGRLGLIPSLVSILKFEKKKQSNSFVGRVESRNTLSDKELEKLEKALSVHSGATIKLDQIKSDLNGVKVEVEDLGLELSFSKDKVKTALLDYIQKAL